MSRPFRAVLALEDGSIFRGSAFGAIGRMSGEVVFNTSMTGYQEVLTDPSYHGQIVVMTAPQIGNTGVNDEDPESIRTHVRGFVAREFSRSTSSHRANRSLREYMEENGIVGIHGIDTRALTRLVREKGCLKGLIVSGPELEADDDPESLLAAARETPDLSELDVVREVTSPRRFEWRGNGDDGPGKAPAGYRRGGPTLAVLDCGMKLNILRRLHAHGARLIVFPAHTPPAQILESHPDGLFVTNGPGNPEQATYAIDTIRELLGKIPVQGICLGHQLVALAAGAKTYKLKFGHHGSNHPVLHLSTGRIEITSQNHNYAVDEDSCVELGFEVTHRNLFDGTVEGMSNPELGVYSIQYHPEAAPGPHDAGYLWEEFFDHLGGKVG